MLDSKALVSLPVTRRLHAVRPLEEAPYMTCNIILVREVEEALESDSATSKERDWLDVELPSYAAANHPGMQQ